MNKPAYIKHHLTNILTISRIVTIYYLELEKNFDFIGESHDFWELVYVDQGELIATAAERDIALHQGDILFHKPNEFHRLRANGQVAPNVFIMTFDCRSSAMNFFSEKHLHLNAQHRKLIGQILSESAQTFNQPFIDPILHKPTLKDCPVLGGQQLIRIYLEQLFILLMRGDTTDAIFPTKDTMDNHLVRRIIQLMEDNLYTHMTIDQLCQKLNYSRTYLCTSFKKATGYSIMQHFTNLKIKEAKKLLREDSLNVAQIAEKLDFCNPHYFSYIFKKTSGLSPKEYQQSVQAAGGAAESLTM